VDFCCKSAVRVYRVAKTHKMPYRWSSFLQTSPIFGGSFTERDLQLVRHPRHFCLYPLFPASVHAMWKNVSNLSTCYCACILTFDFLLASLALSLSRTLSLSPSFSCPMSLVNVLSLSLIHTQTCFHPPVSAYLDCTCLRVRLPLALLSLLSRSCSCFHMHSPLLSPVLSHLHYGACMRFFAHTRAHFLSLCLACIHPLTCTHTLSLPVTRTCAHTCTQVQGQKSWLANLLPETLAAVLPLLLLTFTHITAL